MVSIQGNGPTEPLIEAEGRRGASEMIHKDNAQRLRYFIHGFQQKVFLQTIESAQPSKKYCALTIIPLNPLAPPPLSAAFLQISLSAAVVNRISTPEYPKSAVYCEMSDPRTSVRILRRSGTVSGERVVIDGRRDMNSGMKLNRNRKCI